MISKINNIIPSLLESKETSPFKQVSVTSSMLEAHLKFQLKK